MTDFVGERSIHFAMKSRLYFPTGILGHTTYFGFIHASLVKLQINFQESSTKMGNKFFFT
jgi:hypothetical protein